MNAARIALAQLMVINRLTEPLSEWALIYWTPRTVLPQTLGVSVSKSTKDRLYKTTYLSRVDGRDIQIRKASKPDEEHSRVYQLLGIDWRRAFPVGKTEVKGYQLCSVT